MPKISFFNVGEWSVGAKIIGGTLGTIVLGALGSGVWELLFRPGYEVTRDGFLYIATLGVNSFKDDLYQEIALGLQESASVQACTTILTYVTLGLISLYALVLLIGWEICRGVKKSVLGPTDETENVSAESLLCDIDKQIRWIKRQAIIFVFLSILLIIGTTFSLIKLNYVNHAIAHFNQVENILKPHIAIVDRDIINSQFAQIKNRKDYVQIMDNFNAVASSHDVTLPEFNVW